MFWQMIIATASFAWKTQKLIIHILEKYFDFFSLLRILRIWITCRTLPLILYTLISYGIIMKLSVIILMKMVSYKNILDHYLIIKHALNKNATCHIIAWNIVFVNFHIPLIQLSWEGIDLRLIMIIHYSANSRPCLYYLVQIHTESTN